MKKKFLTVFWRFKEIFLINLTILFLISCQKDDIRVISSSEANEGITFHDGRLIFKDDSTYINHVRWLFKNQNNPQLIAEKNKSFGLKSITEIYLEAMKLEETDPLFLSYVDKYPTVFNKEVYDNSIVYMLPHSKLQCYIANKDGFYQVGDKIKRIAWKYIYQISDSDESKVELLLLPKDQILDKEIKIIPSISEAKNDWAQRTRYFSNSSYRMVSSLKTYTEGIIIYYDIITNPQHKVLGIWGRAQLTTKAAKGYGWWYDIYNGNSPITPNYNQNTGLSQVTIDAHLYPIDMSISYCPAYSRGQFNGEIIYTYWEDSLESPAIWSEPDWTPETEPF